MNLKIELNKNKTQAHVYLELPKRGKNGNWSYVKYNTDDARAWVLEQGYKVKSCLKPATVDNADPKTRQGLWIFELEEPKKTPNRQKPVKKTLELRTDEQTTKKTPSKPRRSRKKTTKEA